MLFNLKKIRKRVIDWGQTRWRKLLQTEAYPLSEKPGRLARKLDYWGGRLILLGVIFLILTQLNLSLKTAGWAAVGLGLGLHLSLKTGKPKLFLRRLRSRVHPTAEETTNLAPNGRPGKRLGRWRGAVGIGLGLIGLGAICGGAWGWYFMLLGLINLGLAVAFVWGERQITSFTPPDPQK